jgi:tripartite-type tricarboxylate transporter receptor subunit TctC
MVGTPFALNPVLRPMPYDALKDFTPVARVASLPFVLAVHSSVPVHSLGELVSFARARPAQLGYATFGFGQLIGERFKSLAKIDMNFVPYQGGVQATVSVAGGHAPVLVGPLSDALPHIGGAKLRPLAVTSAERSDVLKSVPTVAESGYPGFEWMSWIGAMVAAGTPQAALERLSAEMLRAARSEQTKAALERLSVSPAPMSGPAFGAFVRAEMHRYGAIVKQAGIKAD